MIICICKYKQNKYFIYYYIETKYKEMEQNREIRSIARAFTTNGRTVSGYAIRFNEDSAFMGFTERINPSALPASMLENADIFAYFNHDWSKVLARTPNSLKLDLRNDGLYYEFEAPNTQDGNDLLEHIKRGEMYGTSFAFSLPEDGSGEVWTKQEDGTYMREIIMFDALYEISPVYTPAYPTTSVSARCLEHVRKLEEQNMKEDEKDEMEAGKTADPNESKEQEKQKEQDKPVESVESESCESKPDESKSCGDKPDETKSCGDKPDESKSCGNEPDEPDEPCEGPQCDKDDDYKENISNRNKMKKQFSLLKAINDIANNRSLDAVSQAVINAGADEMRSAGQSFSGQIQLPVESRAAVTVTDEHDDVIEVQFADLLTPLRAKNVLVAAGAKYMSGLIGDVQVPIMGAGNVTWEGEVASAKEAGYTFSSKKLQPKRLTAYVDISKQFLVQDSIGAEQAIRADIVAAINSKLESTILGSAQGSTTTPAGIFYGQTPKKITTFKDICDLEASIEDANVIGECKYVMSNKAKAALRNMPKSSKSTQLVMENGEVDGTPVLNTSNVEAQNIAYGDWNNLAIGQWGSIDLVVDPYTLAKDGQVRIVINAFFDAITLRPEAFAFGTTQNG
jgi:HK97 family phage prohead protease/HK97 family phage major capsid protein